MYNLYLYSANAVFSYANFKDFNISIFVTKKLHNKFSPHRLQSKEKSAADAYGDAPNNASAMNGRRTKRTSSSDCNDVRMIVQTLPPNQQHRR